MYDCNIYFILHFSIYSTQWECLTWQERDPFFHCDIYIQALQFRILYIQNLPKQSIMIYKVKILIIWICVPNLRFRKINLFSQNLCWKTCYSTSPHRYNSTFPIVGNYNMASEQIPLAGSKIGKSLYSFEIIVYIIIDVGKIYFFKVVSCVE